MASDMDDRETFLYDVLDFAGARPDTDPMGPAARHAILFSFVWKDMYGVVPSGSVHNRFCDGELPTSAMIDAIAVARFAVGVARMPAPSKPLQDPIAYATSIRDPATLRREILAKLVDRYGGGAMDIYEDISLEEAHSILRTKAESKDLDMERNPVTGHFLGPDLAASSIREYWRSLWSRDVLFASRAAAGKCVFVDSSAENHKQAAARIAAVMAETSDMPITVMSDCPRVLRYVSESLDFYHYQVHVGGAESYAAMPRLFRAFVMVGGSADRPPLSMSRANVWHYNVDGRVSPCSPEGQHTEYTMVADSFAACVNAQNVTGRTAYYVPPFFPEYNTKTVDVGVHPDTRGIVASLNMVEVVPPHLSHTCRIYVSCVSEAGVERCMASGGVAVARSCMLIDDGVNGFLAGGGDIAAVDAAVVRAIGCRSAEIGREASRTRLLFGRDTFEWLWRGILTRSDPMRTGAPGDAVTLHERFLILSATSRYRRLARLRASKTSKMAVMFVDNRPDVGTALAVLITMTNLRSGWGVVGFVTEDSRGLFARFLDHMGPDVVLIDMPRYKKRSFFIEQYNVKMKSLDTWIAVAEHADRVLTVQNDGLIVREGIEQHECTKHDYCGAPWKPIPHLTSVTGGNLVGNGGLSFRSVEAMVSACKNRSRERESIYPLAPLMSEAEDVFFSRTTRACPAKHALGFSMEQTDNPGALGYHRFWMYHPVEFTSRYFETVLRETAAAPPSTKPAIPRPPSRRNPSIL